MPNPIVAAVGSGLGSAVIGSRSASKAASAQKSAAKDQTQLQKQMFDRQDALQASLYGKQAENLNAVHRRGISEVEDVYRDTQGQITSALVPYRGAARDLTRDNLGTLAAGRGHMLSAYRPYIDQGANALGAYAHNLGLGAAPKGYTGLELSPGAQFLMTQGRDTIEGGAAGGGGLYSGATMTALEDYRQGLAATDRDNQMAQLFGLAGMGQQAVGERSAFDQSYGGLITGERTAGFNRNLGLDTDIANARIGARTNLAQGKLGLDADLMSGLSAARGQRANLFGSAAQNYAAGGSNALANYGDASAAGHIGVGNAITGGINNALGIYGALGGQFGQNTPATGTNMLANLFRPS